MVRVARVAVPNLAKRSRYSAPSWPGVAMISGSPPSMFRLYAMLAAQPPYSVRSVGTRNETFTRCSWSASRASAKRPWYCMILSNASDPQIRVVWVIGVAASRIKDGDMVAGWFQLVQLERQLDGLLGMRGKAAGRQLRRVAGQVLVRGEQAPHQRLVVGVV